MNHSHRFGQHRRFGARVPLCGGPPIKPPSMKAIAPKITMAQVPVSHLELKGLKTLRDVYCTATVADVWKIGPATLLKTRNIGVKGVAQFALEVVEAGLATRPLAEQWLRSSSLKAEALVDAYSKLTDWQG